MLKGIGVSTIMKMTIGLLVASLFISAATVGSLYDTIAQGVSDIGDVTDFTTEVEDKNTLSDLAMFVQQRAVDEGCSLVDDVNSGIDRSKIDGYPGSGEVEGYQYLRGTRLTQKPECIGGESSIIRDQLDWLPGRGNLPNAPDENFMPGIYSRELFEVTGESGVLLDTANGNTWLESQLGGAESDDTLNELGEAQRNSGDGAAALPGMMLISTTAMTVQATATLYQEWTDHTPVVDYIVVFETEAINPDSRMAEEAGQIKVQLCPGDEGYIQANREYIDNGDFSDADPVHPVIVIQELGEDCGEVNIDRSDKIPDDTDDERGRLLHITGDTSKDHPYVRGPGLAGGRTNYAFDLLELNENNDEVQQRVYSAAANSIHFTHNSNKADKCVIGMWDHRSSAVDSTGWITFDQGTHISYDGSFPSRFHPDVDEVSLGDRTDRSVPPYPSTENLYDQYAYDGFTGESWGRRDVNNKILYDADGTRKFELYGDLLCAEHTDNDDFDNHHSEWRTCTGSGTARADGETWTCNENGRWTN